MRICLVLMEMFYYYTVELGWEVKERQIGDGSLNLSSRTQILLKQMNSDVFTALFKADTRVRKIDIPWGEGVE